MYEIKSMSYEECRAEHFKALMKKMDRKINYWQGKKLHSLKPLSELSRANNECSEAGMQYSFYKDALEALAAAPKWISVKDPPKNMRKVFVYTFDGTMAVTYYNPLSEMWDFNHDYKITHWTPLPEPPQEEA